VLADTGADSAASATKLDHATHPAKLKRLAGDRLVPYLEDERGRMAAHELPEVYTRNCAVYAARRSSIDAGLIVADDCRAHLMPRERSVDIDSAGDLALAEWYLSRRTEGR
jgi:CMP-N-acetylneuraminic acid synthetase